MNVLSPPQPGLNKGLFNTAMGPLQRQLRSGEYSIFKWASMFESDFVQVSKRGGALDVHNQVRLVRVAIAATTPGLRVPNVLLLARPVFSPEQLLPPRQHTFHHTTPNTRFELTRLLPLCFVKISIHDLEKQQLRFKMATGRTFYLQLCPPLDSQAASFDLWVKVVHLLRPASDLNLAKKEPSGDPGKPGESVLPATESPAPQSPEERECTVADVLSAFQEEGQEDKKNPAEPNKSPYGSPEATSGQEGQTEAESPPASEGPGPDEPLPQPSRGSKKGRSKEHSSAGRKSSTRNKPHKSHRSHSSKRAASRSPSKISSLFMGPFSSSSHKHRKGSTKGKERKR